MECGGYVVKYIKYLQVEYNECQPYIEGATVFSKAKEQFLDITNTYISHKLMLFRNTNIGNYVCIITREESFFLQNTSTGVGEGVQCVCVKL